MFEYDEKKAYRTMQQLAAARGWRARINKDEPRAGENVAKFMLVSSATGVPEYAQGYSLTAREALGILTGTLSAIGDPVRPPD